MSRAASGGPRCSPGLAIVFAVLGITLVGESLNDLADPRLRGRRRVAQAAGRSPRPRSFPAARCTPGPGGHRRPRRRGDIRRARNRGQAMSTVVDIRNLGVSFATDAGAVKAVDDVSLSVAARRGARHRRRVGQRQDRDGEDDPRPAARDGDDAWRGDPHESGGHARERRHHASRSSSCATVRGTDVAMVFQEPSTALNPVYTVGWQIMEGLRAHGDVSKQEARAKAIDILGRVGIPDPEERIDHYPHQFSGGQKQRVVIAMALVLDPGLIVADEPTTALDVTVQAEILDLLRRCRDEFGIGDRADHPQHGRRRRPRRPRGRDVPGQRRRGGRRAHAVRVAAGRLHQGAARGGAVRRSRHGEGRRARARPGPTNWAEQPPVVEAKGLEIEYPGRFGRPGFRAVDGVDLVIRPGEVLGLVGESGSGKTTIGRAIAGLTKVTGGSLKVLGRRDERHPRARLPPAAQPHRVRLPGPGVELQPAAHHRRVRRRAARHPRPGEGRPAARARVDELLEAVQLPERLRRPLPARALAAASASARASRARSRSSPSCSSPTSRPRRSTSRCRRACSSCSPSCSASSASRRCSSATTSRSSTSLADRIAVLYHGKLVEEGTGIEVLGAPADPYTQRLLASLPVPDPVAQAERREELRRLREAD